jgi:odorant receptor
MQEKVEFSSFVKFPLLCFKFAIFDVHPINVDATFAQKLDYIARKCYFVLCMLGFCLCFFSMAMFTVANFENFVEASANIPNVMAGLLIFLKAVAVFLEKNEISMIFVELSECCDKHTDEVSQNKMRTYLNRYLRTIKVYAVTMVFVYLPLLIPVFDFMVRGTMKLPINYWLPFNEKQPVIFSSVVLWIEFFSYQMLVFLLACDSLLYAIITVVAMEFDFLSTDLVNLKLTEKHEKQKMIKSLVERHNKLLELSDRLQNIFALTFLCCFVISSLVMCFIAFQLSTATEISAYGFYIPYLLMIVGQIWLLCSHGQKIIDSSQAVSDAVYDCGWENFNDPILTKQLLLMMIRAQKAKKLTAMNFGNVSLESFNSVSL